MPATPCTRPTTMRRLALLLPALALGLAACAGPRPAAGPTSPAPSSGAPAYETFDPAGYDVRPPVVPAAVEHDVPPRLMEGRVVVPDRGSREPQPRTVDGYRIQVFTSEDRGAAERVRTEAEAWAQGAPGAAARLRGEVAYLAPYYRVRLGAFASRNEAEEALAAVRRRFPEAFLVPDLVTVYE